MAPCPLHFGDWTAHETVQRFLSELPKFDNSTTEERLAFDDFCEGLNSVYFIDCLRNEVKKDEEEQEKGVFKNIERIVKEFGEENKWKKFPNLSILLLSIARTPLESQDKEFTRETLLRGVREIYDHFNEKSESCDSDSPCCLCNKRLSQNVKESDFCESRSLVFRAGCQLLPFQDENTGWKNWKNEFAEFRRRHSEEISKFRMLYYSTDNITVFIHRIVERWKRNNASIAKQFDLEDYDDLNPLRFELPVQSRSAEVFKFTNRFAQDFEDPEKNKRTISEDFVEKLAEKFRIIQWEILVRDIIEEAAGNRLCFYPISVEHTISGMSDEDFLKKFINQARKIECHFEPSYGEIPTKKRYDEASLPDEKISLNDDQVEEVTKCRKSFDILLSEAPNSYSFVHEDLVESFANLRTSDKSSNESFNTMLIEDGELSFFSLLWLLRYAAKQGEEPENWQKEPRKKLTIRFRLKKSSSEPNWSECNMHEFAEECGLIIFLKNDQIDGDEDPFQCIRTRRWTSLITWLRRLNDNLKGTREADEKYLQEVEKLDYTWLRRLKNDNLKGTREADEEYLQEVEKLNYEEYLQEVEKLDYGDSLLKRLRIKILDYDKERTYFIRKLQKFLASNDLTNMLNKLDKSLFDPSASYKDFTEELGYLVKSLDNYSLLEVESSAGLGDKVLLRCCRGFIPIEHLIRAYKPCEFHLLFQALNWEESYPGDSKQAPISIGCATIAGQVEMEPMGESEMSQKTTIGGVETDSDSRDDSESSEVTVTDFDRWVDPYRTLFSTLSTNFALPDVKKASEKVSEQIGAQRQQGDFAHQTSSTLDTIFLDPKHNVLNFHSQFALWLVRSQTTYIWGGFALDPRRLLTDDEQGLFSHWADFEARQIVDELVNIGLHGGIVRTYKSDSKYRLKEHGLDLDEQFRLAEEDPEEVEQFFSKVRKDLSLDTSNLSDPPDWVKTQAFAICFHHGLRQAAYHALDTFVNNNRQKQPNNPYLSINWQSQSVSICNRGKANSEVPKDRGFFERFMERINEFCDKEKIDERFKISGPEPDSPDTWRLVIKKE